MKVTVIAEGSTKKHRLLRQWGISFLVGDNIIFDAFGRTDIFQKNIAKFRMKTEHVKHIVISHDDWDHIDGLWYLLERIRNARVYVCPHFSKETKDRIRSYPVKMIEVKGFTRIDKNVYSTGEMIGHSDGRVVYEQSLVLRTPKGIVIITGCAHQGIINIVEKVTKRFKGRIYLLIGGMHLRDAAKEDVKKIVIKLKNHGIEKISPMHCTGSFAAGVIKKTFGVKSILAKQGTVIHV